MKLETDAVFSPCRKWRYNLWRYWDRSKKPAVFLLMNPSTADEIKNDPTVERCQRRAEEWHEQGWLDVGGVEVVNVFAWRETDSKKLFTLAAKGVDIVGPHNNAAILEVCQEAAIIVCGWGKPGHFLLQRGKRVIKGLKKNGITKLHALRINKDGSPQHPLYIGYDVKPRLMP